MPKWYRGRDDGHDPIDLRNFLFRKAVKKQRYRTVNNDDELDSRFYHRNDDYQGFNRHKEHWKMDLRPRRIIRRNHLNRSESPDLESFKTEDTNIVGFTYYPNQKSKTEVRNSPISDVLGHEALSEDASCMPSDETLKSKASANKICILCESTDHDAYDCVKVICCRCNEAGHLFTDCPKALNGLEGTLKKVVEDSDSNEKKYSQITCFNCGVVGHHIRVCPILKYRKYEEKEHFSRECVTNDLQPSVALSFKPIVIEKEFKPITFEYDSRILKSSQVQISPPSIINTNSLYNFYVDYLRSQGRPISFADEKLSIWRSVSHTEDTLKLMLLREKPESEDSVKFLLQQELCKVSAERIPISINIDELINETASYFWVALTDTQQETDNSFEKFKKMGETIVETHVSTRREFEVRFDSLQPLSDYMARRMLATSNFVNVSERYIYMVSSTIQKLIAHVGMSAYKLKRMVKEHGGMDVIKMVLTEKLLPYAESFPPSVEIKHILNMACDFVDATTIYDD